MGKDVFQRGQAGCLYQGSEAPTLHFWHPLHAVARYETQQANFFIMIELHHGEKFSGSIMPPALVNFCDT